MLKLVDKLRCCPPRPTDSFSSPLVRSRQGQDCATASYPAPTTHRSHHRSAFAETQRSRQPLGRDCATTSRHLLWLQTKEDSRTYSTDSAAFADQNDLLAQSGRRGRGGDLHALALDQCLDIPVIELLLAALGFEELHQHIR